VETKKIEIASAKRDDVCREYRRERSQALRAPIPVTDRIYR